MRVEGWLCDSCGLENDATDFPCKGCRYPLVPPAAFHARSEEDGGTEEEQGNVFDGILGDSSVPQEAQNAARARRKVDVCHGSSAGSSEADGGSESVSASPEGMLYEGHARRTHRRRHHPPPLEHELRALPLDLQHAMAAPGDEHEWQCDMCLLASEGPPCICCGYDPAEVEGVPPDLSAVPPAAAEAAELAESTYPDHLRAAASMLAVHEDEEEAAVAARRLATELTAAAKIVGALWLQLDLVHDRQLVCEIRFRSGSIDRDRIGPCFYTNQTTTFRTTLLSHPAFPSSSSSLSPFSSSFSLALRHPRLALTLLLLFN